MVRGGAKSAPSSCCTGRYREERGISSKVVSVERASRNTHLHEQVGASEWAIQDSKLLDQNHVADIENKENDNTHTQGGAKSAPSENKREQFVQLLQAFNALTPDERSALLKALGGGAVESLQL